MFLDRDGVINRRRLDHVKRWGTPVILSDGDAVFQPRKVARSGLWSAVEGHVLIYIHKEECLRDVQQRYPAQRYVLVDDKLRILAAVKHAWRHEVCTVFPRQGHYARDAEVLAHYPPSRVADLSIERIGNLLEYDFSAISQLVRKTP